MYGGFFILCAVASFRKECRFSDGGDGQAGPTLPGNSSNWAI